MAYDYTDYAGNGSQADNDAYYRRKGIVNNKGVVVDMEGYKGLTSYLNNRNKPGAVKPIAEYSAGAPDPNRPGMQMGAVLPNIQNQQQTQTPPKPMMSAINNANTGGAEQNSNQTQNQTQPEQKYGTLSDMYNQLNTPNPYRGVEKERAISNAMSRVNGQTGRDIADLYRQSQSSHSGSPIATANAMRIAGTEAGSRAAFEAEQSYVDKAYNADMGERKQDLDEYNVFEAARRQGKMDDVQIQQAQAQMRHYDATIRQIDAQIDLAYKNYQLTKDEGEANKLMALKQQKAKEEADQGAFWGKVVQFVVGAGMTAVGVATGIAPLIPAGITVAAGSFTGDSQSTSAGVGQAVNGVADYYNNLPQTPTAPLQATVPAPNTSLQYNGYGTQSVVPATRYATPSYDPMIPRPSYLTQPATLR